MGAEGWIREGVGRNVEDAYNRLKEEDLHMNGHSGYTGDIGQSYGYFKVEPKAGETLDEMSQRLDYELEKRGPAAYYISHQVVDVNEKEYGIGSTELDIKDIPVKDIDYAVNYVIPHFDNQECVEAVWYVLVPVGYSGNEQVLTYADELQGLLPLANKWVKEFYSGSDCNQVVKPILFFRRYSTGKIKLRKAYMPKFTKPTEFKNNYVFQGVAGR